MIVNITASRMIAAHNRRRVLHFDRQNDKTSQTVHIEHALCDDCAAEQTAEGGCNRCNNGQQRVFQRMAVCNHAPRHALCLRGGDVVLPHNLEHRRARDAQEFAAVRHARRNHRQNVALPACVAAGRQPAEIQRKHQNQHHSEPERRNCNEEHRTDAEDLVCNRVLVRRGEHTERNADQHGKQRADTGQASG